ncbi:MAG: glycosyltransferase [Sphingobium sp.]|nr:glycosyltransferase [Sphingobium sp.]
MIKRVFYACGGPANVVSAHEAWLAKEHESSEVSITFSSQVADYCEEIGASAYFVSPHAKTQRVQMGEYTLEHRPKKGGSGVGYHLNEIGYALGLLKTARAFKADIAFMDTGSMPIFTMFLFRLFGIPVVPILHNVLWPAHFPPTSFGRKLALWVDGLFWRYGASGAIGVSPECEKQVRAVAPGLRYPVIQIRAQFRPEYFAQIAPPPPHAKRPFRVMFIGRVTHSKGVFDILEMARSVETTDPGLVRWTICGTGDAFDALTAQRDAMGLQDIVDLPGWISLERLLDIYAQSHAAIVPTRSSFQEALAMTAAEAILAGRPVILNPVVPAIDLIGPACLAGKTNDAESHAEQVRLLARDGALYDRMQKACASLGAPFVDRQQGLTAGLREMVRRLGLD